MDTVLLVLIVLMISTIINGQLIRYNDELRSAKVGALNYVYAIYEDELMPGRLIVSNQTNLFYMDSISEETSPFVGQRGSSKVMDGFGENATFSFISDFAQGPGANSTDTRFIYVTEYTEHCIRRVNRETLEVKVIIGYCGVAGFLREDDGEVLLTFRHAKLYNPTSIKFFPIHQLYYILNGFSDQLIWYNATAETLKYVVGKNDDDKMNGCWDFLPTTDYKSIYISFAYGISKYTFATESFLSITGNPNSDGTERKDGSFDEALFQGLGGLAWIIPDLTLAVTGFESHSLRILNLNKETVSTLCGGKGREFVAGGISQCEYFKPNEISVINNTIYVGDDIGGGAASILKISFIAPAGCNRNELDVNGYNVTTTYTLYSEIRLTCNASQGIETGPDRQICTEYEDESRNVKTRWEPAELTTCQDLSWSSIYPSAGQLSGGTRVTLKGVLPQNFDLEVRPPVNSINCNKNTQCSDKKIFVHFEDVTGGVNFKMDSADDFGLNTSAITEEGKVLVEILVLGLPPLNYTFLPDPIIEEELAQRTKAIKSGGQILIFNGRFIKSSRVYRIHCIAPGPRIFKEDCYLQEDGNNTLVHCPLPNMQEEIEPAKNPVKREVEEPQRVDVEVYGDDHLVTSTEMLLLIYPDPTFNEWQELRVFNAFDKKEVEIVLAGENVNTAAETNDYVVSVYHSNTNYPCEVVNIMVDSLTCRFDAELINTDKDSVQATVKVELGNALYNLGEIQIRFRPEQVTGWWVWLVISIAAALLIAFIVIIIYFCKTRRGRNRDRLLLRDHQHEMSETQHIRVRYSVHHPDASEEDADLIKINPELMQKCEGMFINPDLLIAVSDKIIGKGYFGNVTTGQLVVKEDDIENTKLVMTVAVKTIKASQRNTDSVEKFLEEASLLYGFEHDNILFTIGIVWLPDTDPKVILPYMAQGDLCSVLRNPEYELTNGDVLHFGMQIAAGMEFLASHKMVHRDLAARNCLIDKNFVLKVSDFGMSRDIYSENYYRESNQDQPKPIRWMAPESLLEGVYTPMSDVWSFGVVMWEMYTKGSTPYPAILNNDLLEYICDGRATLNQPSQCADLIYMLMKRCWEFDASDRPGFGDIKRLFMRILGIDTTDDLPDSKLTENTSLFASYENFHRDQGSYVRCYTKAVRIGSKRSQGSLPPPYNNLNITEELGNGEGMRGSRGNEVGDHDYINVQAGETNAGGSDAPCIAPRGPLIVDMTVNDGSSRQAKTGAEPNADSKV